MKNGPIRTKWHRILPLIEQNEAYLTAPPNSIAPHSSKYEIDFNIFKAWLPAWNQLPKFVIDSELLSLASEEDYLKSLLDMRHAGVLRLPFPGMVVEYSKPDDSHHCIVLLRDMAATDTKFSWEDSNEYPKPFYAMVLRIQKDKDGEYLVLSPSLLHLDLEKGDDGKPWIGITAELLSLSKSTTKLNTLCETTYQKDAGVAWRALSAALLLMATDGVKKEVIETSRLNKHRLAAGKEPIPTHTYIRIGHVYRSNSGNKKDEYIARKSPRPHWRRGHLRTVHFGKAGANSKQVYVQPKLVAWHGATQPLPPQGHEYVVTR